MTQKTKVFIDGEAGTTGLLIREKLTKRDDILLLSIDPDKRKDWEEKRRLLTQSDIAILCLPDDAARASVAMIDAMASNERPRILDASTAHRTAPDWVYGFAELTVGQGVRIAAAERVANPGCYATGAIAIVRPLLEAGLIRPDQPLSINAVSGYSGGGRSMIEDYEAGRGSGFMLYALQLQHKHLPEIMAHTGLTRPPLFAPSVGAFRQGMLVSVPLHLDELPAQPTAQRLSEVLSLHYAGSEFVNVHRDAQPQTNLEAEPLNGSNMLDIRVYANEKHRQALIVARLDNLGKGASGAAVQNLELMISGGPLKG